MDLAKRDALLRRIGTPDPRDSRACIDLEAFFEGNDDLASFWCNLADPPRDMGTAHAFLRGIRARPDVRDVRIQITQFDGGAEEWPFSDTVIVATEAPPEVVRDWFARYPPDAADPVPGPDLGVRLWWD